MRWILYGTVKKRTAKAIQYRTHHRFSSFFQNDQENNPKGITVFLIWFDKIYLVAQSLKKARVAIAHQVRGQLRVGYLSSKANVTSMLVNVRIQYRACGAT
jgi:hypothetical protein